MVSLPDRLRFRRLSIPEKLPPSAAENDLVIAVSVKAGSYHNLR